ncbi:MAG TPA: nuclear transport factor 2 family protein [Thermoleophilaceae bacterium]|jgi:ketosteroid isomerase-like protein
MTAMPEILGGVSEETLDLVRRTTEAWNRGDVDSVAANLSPDAEWEVAENNPDARTLRGRDEIRAYLADWRDTIVGLHYEATQVLDAADAVVQVGVMTGHIGEGGPALTAELCFVTRFVDGEAVRTEEYLDAEDALAAAGLSR